MKLAMPRLLTVLCVLLGLTGRLVQGRDNVLSAIPADAVGFAVVHNLSDTSRSIGEIAKVVQAPAPDLLSMAKGMTGLQKGIDEQGDLALVLTSVDPAPKHVILAPVASFADFFAALNVKEPETGVVEVQLAGTPSVVGRKGSYAAMARVADRDALEKLLASTANLTGDASLAAWLDANRVSVVVTSQGIKQSLPKLTNGIRALQAQMQKAAGENGKTTAEALNLYLDLFTAAERQVEQFGVGVRIDSAQTVDFVSRVQFVAGGSWANWAAKAKPATEDLLSGLESKPFVLAGGGAVPEGAMKQMMKMSAKMMQNEPYKLTPEQAQKYAELGAGMMEGVTSMRMLMGVAEPSTGVYGNTSAVTMVNDSKSFLDAYEKSLSAMGKLAEETKSPAMPVATSQRIKVGEIDALEVSMTLPNVKQFAAPGGPDPQKMMHLFLGPDGKLKIYLAPADEHTVVMAYVSSDHLKEAIEFYKSKQPGLSGDPGLAKVAGKLPAGSQFVAYVSVSGVAQTVKQWMAIVPGVPTAAIPDFPDSPPFGYAAKISPAGVEGHSVVMVETLRTIGDTVAKARADAHERRLQQQRQ
jgi:hypothetical protein